MKFTLRVQVFLAFALFSLLLTGGLYVYSRLSFEQSFNHYVEQKEAQRSAKLITALGQHYQRHKSWNNFKNNRQYWDNFVWRHTDNWRYKNDRPLPLPLSPDAHFDSDAEPRSARVQTYFMRRETTDGRTEEFAHSLRNDNFLRHQPYRRFILLDSKKNLVSGKKWANERYFLHEIELDIENPKNLVGYLGTPINRALRDLRDNEFAKRQQNHFLFTALAGLLIALLCAVPLSQLLTGRVKKLAQQVQRLSSGDYEQRLNTQGQDEIAKLAEHLNHLAHTLSQSEQTRKRWVADISHELRTPLAVFKADLEALEDGVRQFDQKTLQRLQKHAARLANLVNDLYQLSLTDIGAMSYRKQDCNLVEIIEETRLSLQDRLKQQNLTLVSDIAVQHIPIFADPERLHQLFLNLFNNSINYTQAPGQIKVSLALSTQGKLHGALFTIEDSAPGVDPSLHEKLFERLYRAESSRSRETGGAGLGLSICRNICEAHKGSIDISNSSLGGLKVSVFLPLQEKE